MDKEKELESIKKLLSSLIISSPRGLTAKRLLIDYRNEIGKDIPFKNYGFYSFDAFLQSLTDVCRLHGTGPNALVEPVINEKVKHINDMILKQKKKPVKNYRGRIDYRPQGIQVQASQKKDYSHIQLPQLAPNPTKVVLPPPVDYYLDQRAKNQRNSNKTNARPTVQKNQGFNFNVEKFNSPNKKFEFNFDASNISTASFEYQANKPSNYKPEVKIFGNINLESTEQVEAKAQPEFSYAPDPELRYRDEETGSNGDEYCSELDFSEISDEDYVYNSDEDQRISTDITNDKSSKNIDHSEVYGNEVAGSVLEESNTQKPLFGSRITKEIRNNLAILIAEHEDGIWCSKLLELYSRRFGINLDPYDFGFSSVSQMCEVLPELFHMVRPGHGDYKLFDKNLPKPETSQIDEWVDYLKKFNQPTPADTTIAPFPKEITEAKVPVSIKYPNNVVQLGTEIELQEMPSHTKLNDYVDIVVSEVYDPSKYWFQLKSELDKVDVLMDELQIFYSTNKAEYAVPLEYAQEGLYCSALILGEYHRGVINKTHSDGTVKIFFIDYGTVADINIKKVYFLHEQFSYLPRQALRGKLSNIIPKEQNTMWPRAASRRFLELISNKNLVGYLTHIDYNNYTFSFIITDITDNDIDIHINDTLIDDGYAVPGNKSNLCPTSRAIIPNVHLYPTFDEIEYGLCPTVGDLDRFEKLDFELEDIFTDYFTPKQCSNADSMYFTNNENGPLDASYSNSTLDDISTTENLTQSETNLLENKEICDKLEKTVLNEDHNLKIESSKVNDLKLTQEFENQSCGFNQGSKLPPGLVTSHPNSTKVQSFDANLQTVVPELQNQTESSPTTENQELFDPTDFINSYYYLKVLISSQSALYDNNVFQMLILHLKDCDNILKLFSVTKDKNELCLLKNTYLAKVDNIKNILLFQKLQNTLLPVQQVLPQNVLSLPQFNPNMVPQLNPNVLPLQTLQQINLSHVNHPLLQQNRDYNLNANNINTNTETQTNCEDNNSKKSQNLIVSSNLEESNSNFNDTTNNKLHTITNTDSDSKSSSSNEIDLVKKLKIKHKYIFDVVTDTFKMHILKIDDGFYMTTQEMITVLLESKEQYSSWIKSCTINCPSRVVNLKNYKEFFDQIKYYNIPGIQGATNIGCYTRLIPMKQVPKIVHMLGKKEIYEDINFVVQSLDLS